MRSLVQKTLKMELRLKGYKAFKFQGLDCKSVGARFKIYYKIGG
jgi:hypothetical protein